MTIVNLPNVRLSFPDLFVAKPFKAGDKPRFSGTFLIPKGGNLHQQIEKAIEETAAAKPTWGSKAKTLIASIRNNPNKFCYQDGDLKSWDGYQGMMALTAHSQRRPEIRDRDKSPLTEADGRPYGGCYVYASVEFFTYDNSGKGIGASLRGVQFYKDGDAFAGGTPMSDDEFEDLAVDGGELA